MMNLDSEHWRHSPIFPDRYLISDDGKLYSILNDMLIKPETTAKGYYRYFLYEKGKERKAKAHRLVAMAFIPNPENKPQIDHINGIKTDNRVCNLRWCNNTENMNNPVTVETGEVYMTGVDYNLYIEGYKDGKRDFEPKQGEWVRKEDVIHSIAQQYSAHNELVPFWLSIGDIQSGAKMQKGGAE